MLQFWVYIWKVYSGMELELSKYLSRYFFRWLTSNIEKNIMNLVWRIYDEIIQNPHCGAKCVFPLSVYLRIAVIFIFPIFLNVNQTCTLSAINFACLPISVLLKNSPYGASENSSKFFIYLFNPHDGLLTFELWDILKIS